MATDRSEQPQGPPRSQPGDPETPDDDAAVYLVPLGEDVDLAGAQELLRALPGVTGVSVDADDRSIMVWGARDLLSEHELAAAVEDSSQAPGSPGER